MENWDSEAIEATVVGNEFGDNRRAVPKQTEAGRSRTGRIGSSVTADAIRAIEEEVSAAQRIVLSLPGDRMVAGLRGGKSCLGSLVITEIDEDAPVVIKTAQQITRSLNLIELLLQLKEIEPFIIRMVLLRAMPKKAGWKRICKMDPKGRCRRQLFNLHREALAALWTAMRNKK